MTRLSANLGFLWQEMNLPQAIHAAADAGFGAVECHWPYETPVDELKQALADTGLPMLGLNTFRGDVEGGDNGICAIPGRESEARKYIDEAVVYAAKIDCKNVHVMAGRTDKGQLAQKCFHENLRYACESAQPHGITILIEPLNHYDAPGYHLSTLDEASNTLNELSLDNLKIMFDCYHMQIMHGDLCRRLSAHLNQIGHIQIAAVPDRSEPDNGELHYPNLLKHIDSLGWTGYIGAEYKPRTTTDAGLDWLKAYQSQQ